MDRDRPAGELVFCLPVRGVAEESEAVEGVGLGLGIDGDQPETAVFAVGEVVAVAPAGSEVFAWVCHGVHVHLVAQAVGVLASVGQPVSGAVGGRGETLAMDLAVEVSRLPDVR